MPVPTLKSTVAALLASVWISAPAVAQDSDAAEGPPADEAPADPAARQADLLRQLAEAENPYAAGLVLGELHTLWSRSGSPSIDLLVRRGQEALESGDPEAAVEHFTAAIDHGPDFAGGYAGRAAAYYATGRVGPALDDLRQALVLNPDDIDSLQGFASLLEELGRPEDALEVWTRVADMNPQGQAARQAVDRLTLSLEGTAL